MMHVVCRQWAAISHFQDKLVNGALSALASPDVTPVVCIFASHCPFKNMLAYALTLLNIFLSL